MSDQGWGPLHPFTIGGPSEFPVAALPAGMAKAVNEVAEAIGADPAFAATAFLGAAAGAAGPLTEIQIRETWREHCNLFVAVVATTGTKKTPSIEPARAPLEDIENLIAQAADETRREAAVMLPIQRDRLKKMQREDPPDKEGMASLAADIEKAEKATSRDARLIVDDVTFEKLAVLLNDNDGHLIALADEGALLWHALGNYTSQPNIDPLLKAWDGSTLIIDRKGGSGTPATVLHVENPRLTVSAVVQPTTIARFGEQRNVGLIERGLLARFLISWPKSRVGEQMLGGRVDRPYQHVDPWNRQVVDQWQRGHVFLTFDKQAQDTFIRWHDQVEAALPNGKRYETVRAFAPKVRAQTARMAGLFARFDRATLVKAEHVEQAIQLGDYYLEHSQAVVESWASASSDKARKFGGRLPSLVQPDEDGRLLFTVREAQRWAHLKAVDMLDALDLLHAHGYVRPADPNQGFGSAGRVVGKKSPLVELNPALRTEREPA